MLFTREPIIETVITARSGYRLSVRNSKSPIEELLVDALEIVSFGQALFFRCVERPKAFLFPVSDYEVSEVRETRLVLKHMVQEGKKNSENTRNHRQESHKQDSHRQESHRQEPRVETRSEDDKQVTESESAEGKESGHSRNDRRRERRRQRRRRGDKSDSGANHESEASEEEGDDVEANETVSDVLEVNETSVVTAQEAPAEPAPAKRGSRQRGAMQLVSALIPPPPTLVSDLFRYEHLDNEGVRAAVEQNEDPVQSARNQLVDALHARDEIDLIP